MAKEDFLKKYPTFGKALNKSIVEAYEYYKNHVEEANKWYMEESKISNLNDSIFKIAAKFEPNLIKENKISIRFSEDDYQIMDEASQFVEKNVGKKVNMKQFVTNEYVDSLNPKGTKK